MLGSSTSASADTEKPRKPVPPLPPREDVVAALLKLTARGAVPIRSAFVQKPQGGAGLDRSGPLSAFTSDDRGLDAYLLIHALASAKAPYVASYPARTWSHAAGFDRHASDASARQRWAKAVTKLKALKLIDIEQTGGKAKYTLLHESGSGEAYTRPTKLAHGGWVALPHSYWTDDLYIDMSLPEKLMLLVSLDQKSPFALPAARVPSWYGISESSAERGFAALLKREILSAEKATEVDVHNRETLLRTYNVYSTEGAWTTANRKKAMTVSRGRAKLSP